MFCFPLPYLLCEAGEGFGIYEKRTGFIFPFPSQLPVVKNPPHPPQWRGGLAPGARRGHVQDLPTAWDAAVTDLVAGAAAEQRPLGGPGVPSITLAFAGISPCLTWALGREKARAGGASSPQWGKPHVLLAPLVPQPTRRQEAGAVCTDLQAIRTGHRSSPCVLKDKSPCTDNRHTNRVHHHKPFTGSPPAKMR